MSYDNNVIYYKYVEAARDFAERGRAEQPFQIVKFLLAEGEVSFAKASDDQCDRLQNPYPRLQQLNVYTRMPFQSQFLNRVQNHALLFQ